MCNRIFNSIFVIAVIAVSIDRANILIIPEVTNFVLNIVHPAIGNIYLVGRIQGTGNPFIFIHSEVFNISGILTVVICRVLGYLNSEGRERSHRVNAIDCDN